MIMPLLQGLKITFLHMFKKPVTLQYPKERPVVVPNYRGLHALKVSHEQAKCVACYLCPTVCPAKCITVEAGEDAKHDKYAARYEIDLLRCIFCGYCVEACPVDALKMTQEFELANYKREDFVFVKERLLEKK
ncbi:MULTISPECIES: NADH-quinone oxidoreductase subunit NuoI [Geobacteraceae]|uniref:NADH-quinone oxidoreductase subunit I n=1 Tax=Geomobilimonas luticola TaxID=1114878 RepID=A0ABS5S9Q2_9BACT|nr:MULTISPECIES: NADH-quinone oxidoreductase subunit NuoI [Geobacteraceae]MBT0651875.1 NADH-quinone oxidoreductase subunit NuoI [Geomobilimonas luticola]GFE56886.1 NADH-quinone oxidoreductase subunit I 1 [Geobacter sp. AOG1]HEX5774044.1 NADH-quinone oxidoreductase subunit NuoI [Geomobilimonas sp.]